MEQQVVRTSVEVRSGTARFRVGVQVRSIKKALNLVAGRYPRGVVRVAFPIEPEGFFAHRSSKVIGNEQIPEVAA